MADILNQGPAFWLPPDFLSDEDDDILIPADHNINTLLHNYYYSAFPPKVKLPYSDMESTHKPQVHNPPDFKSAHHLTPNGFRFPHPSLPSPPRNPLASLYAHYYNNDISTIPICGRSSRDIVYCSHQKFMFQKNRQGNRVFGETSMASRSPPPPPHSAWTPLSHQRPNTPPLRGGSVFLNGSHEVKRKCSGTGVFLPRQYGNPVSDCPKKSGLVTPQDQVQVRKNPVGFESHFIQNEDAEAMAARTWKKVQLMNQKQRTEGEGGGGSSNELCLPHEWAY